MSIVNPLLSSTQAVLSDFTVPEQPFNLVPPKSLQSVPLNDILPKESEFYLPPLIGKQTQSTLPNPNDLSNVSTLINNKLKVQASQLPYTKYTYDEVERYDENGASFDPIGRTEDFLARKDGPVYTAGRNLLFGTMKGLAQAGLSFVDGLTTLPTDIGEPVNEDSILTSNQRMLKNLENKLPNFRTDQSFWDDKLINSSNFLGDDIIKNLGFMVGSIGGSAVQGMIAGALTEGTGAVASLAKIPKTLMTIPSMIRKASMVNAIRNLGKLSSIGTSGLDGAIGLARSSGNTIEAINLAANGQRVKNLSQFVYTSYMAGLGESIVEGFSVYDEMQDTLLKEQMLTKGYYDEDDLKKIDKESREAARITTWSNIPITTLTNIIQFPTILGLTGKVIQKATSPYVKVGVKNGFFNVVNKLDGKDANKILKKAAGKQIATDFGAEFLQEGSQAFTGNAVTDYYTQRFNSDIEDGLIDHVYDNIPKYLSDPALYHEALIGGLIGGGVSSYTAYKDYAKGKSDAKRVVEGMSSVLTQDRISDAVKDLSNSISQINSVGISTGKDDLIKHRNIFGLTETSLKYGTLDSLIDSIDDLKVIPIVEFNNGFGYKGSEEMTSEQRVQHLDNLKGEILRNKKILEDVHLGIKKNPFNELTNRVTKLFKPKSESQLQAHQDILFNRWKGLVAYNLSRQETLDRKSTSIKEDIKTFGLGEDTAELLTQDGFQDIYKNTKKQELSSLIELRDYYVSLEEALNSSSNPITKETLRKEYEASRKKDNKPIYEVKFDSFTNQIKQLNESIKTLEDLVKKNLTKEDVIKFETSKFGNTIFEPEEEQIKKKLIELLKTKLQADKVKEDLTKQTTQPVKSAEDIVKEHEKENLEQKLKATAQSEKDLLKAANDRKTQEAKDKLENIKNKISQLNEGSTIEFNGKKLTIVKIKAKEGELQLKNGSLLDKNGIEQLFDFDIINNAVASKPVVTVIPDEEDDFRDWDKLTNDEQQKYIRSRTYKPFESAEPFENYDSGTDFTIRTNRMVLIVDILKKLKDGAPLTGEEIAFANSVELIHLFSQDQLKDTNLTNDATLLLSELKQGLTQSKSNVDDLLFEEDDDSVSDEDTIIEDASSSNTDAKKKALLDYIKKVSLEQFLDDDITSFYYKVVDGKYTFRTNEFFFSVIDSKIVPEEDIDPAIELGDGWTEVKFREPVKQTKEDIIDDDDLFKNDEDILQSLKDAIEGIENKDSSIYGNLLPLFNKKLIEKCK